MGMDQAVTFTGSIPSWLSVRDMLAQRHFPVVLRMIDGELAFPGEMPPDSWQELRFGTPQGMVTVRRQPEGVVCVTWGNADEPLLQAWNALAWAFAEAGGGRVLSREGSQDAAEFHRRANLPSVLRTTTEQVE